MIGQDGAGRRWSVGEVARASGLTVRALYHYDEIGLLRASERTAAGHRRYTDRDLRRLYRIRALRTLGLPLEEIAGVLTEPVGDLTAMRALLTAQLDGLRADAERIQRLQDRVRGLLGQIDNASMPGPDQFMATLEMMSMFETSFTPEQRERLAGRRAALGAEAVEAARTEWAGLVEELLRHVQDRTPVDDPRVRALVGRWDALGDRFHAGGDDDRTRPPRGPCGGTTAKNSARTCHGPPTGCANWSPMWSGPGRPDDRDRVIVTAHRVRACRAGTDGLSP